MEKLELAISMTDSIQIGKTIFRMDSSDNTEIKQNLKNGQEKTIYTQENRIAIDIITSMSELIDPKSTRSLIDLQILEKDQKEYQDQ